MIMQFRAWNGTEILHMPITTTFGIYRFFGMLHDECNVMQYTGQIDKNNNQVCESDYVKACRQNSGLGSQVDIYEIVWSDKFCSWALFTVKSNNPYRIGKLILKANDQPYLLSNIIEVIGNKYESKINDL